MQENRRNFLKFLILGSGIFAFGKFFDRLPYAFGLKKSELKIGDGSSKQTFQNFQVFSEKGELIISDRIGKRILIIDNDEI